MGAVVVDSSVLLALLLHEADAGDILLKIREADRLFLSSLNYMETGAVWDNHISGKTDPAHLDLLMAKLEVEVMPVDFRLAQAAREAYRRFGKGRHPARLNMGDCFAYALAKDLGVPLLYKGADFSLTDLATAP